MKFQRIILACALGLSGARAEAHAFKSGADQYAQFVEGVAVILQYPETLLPLLSLGLLLGLWQSEGMLRAWPVFLAGQLAGIGLAATVGPWITLAILGAGTVTAIIAALMPRHVWAEAIGLSLVLGALVTAASLEGHGLLELPLLIHLGILFAVNLVTASTAGIVRATLERVSAPWMPILWRIAASWLAAILVLFLAFSATGN